MENLKNTKITDDLSCENIDHCVEEYINKNKNKLVSGKKAEEAFKDVESSLNVDNAFIYEIKEFDGIPALYMKSSKSKTLVLVYFAIKDEARHIEFKPKELIDMCDACKNSGKKEEKSMINTELINETIDRLYEKAALCESAEEAEVYVAKAEELQEAISETVESSYELEDLINETVDRLYEKAALCESGDDAEVYIKKAEELQKAIDDIPEEDPVDGADYPEETSGGAGEKIDQEEIKELVGDDEEALKLLNIDTQSVTIDA